MIDEATFGKLIDQVVEHLYDQPFLQTHPLGHLLAAKSVGGSRGQALQRIILDASQSLKPAGTSVGTAHAWRTYRYLFLRFVQALSPGEVANDLAIGERQARRVYREALDALASVLWDRLGNAAVGAGAAGRVATDETISLPEGSLLDQEIRQLTSEIHRGVTALTEILEGLRPIVDPLAERYACTWSAELTPGLPPVATDRIVVRQVFLNFFLTAFARGPGWLRLRASPAGDRVRIALTLSPASQLPELAEARLAVSRQLIEAEEGTLETHREADGGLLIEVSLPTGRRPVVLVVDDNPDVVGVLQRYLESAGCEVLTAQSSAEGFRIARQARLAAITLDVMMPSQDGWETLQLLKNHPETEAIPVVICSVLREDELARFLGAAEVLLKPVTRPTLLAAMARCGVPIRPPERRSSP
jgi:CheY-like chemotaxis protein